MNIYRLAFTVFVLGFFFAMGATFGAITASGFDQMFRDLTRPTMHTKGERI